MSAYYTINLMEKAFVRIKQKANSIQKLFEIIIFQHSSSQFKNMALRRMRQYLSNGKREPSSPNAA